MLASIVESGGVVSVFATSLDDTVIISSAQPGETQISINHTQSDAVFGQFVNTDISRVVVYAGDGDDFVYSSARVPTEISGQGGNDRLEGGFVDDVVRGGNGSDIIFGKAGNDLVNGNAGNDNVNGGSGDDVVLGGTGNDFLVGGNGDDLVDGQSGSDTLNGGAGNDRVFGFAGNDVLYGGDGNDRVIGGQGVDQVYGGAGDDSVRGSEGNDSIFGGDGNDFLNGEEGDDTVNGQNGNDFVYGGTGDDTLVGGLGDDFLVGQMGADTLTGNAGDDVLFGGDNRFDDRSDGSVDQLTGSSGLDRFYAENADVISDQQSGEEIIISDQGNTNDDDDDFSESLFALLATFGVSLTGRTSTALFNAASADIGTQETIGDLRVVSANGSHFVFQSDDFLTGVPSTTVRHVGTLSDSLPTGFASTLSVDLPENATRHVAEREVIAGFGFETRTAIFDVFDDGSTVSRGEIFTDGADSFAIIDRNTPVDAGNISPALVTTGVVTGQRNTPFQLVAFNPIPDPEVDLAKATRDATLSTAKDLFTPSNKAYLNSGVAFSHARSEQLTTGFYSNRRISAPDFVNAHPGAITNTNGLITFDDVGKYLDGLEAEYALLERVDQPGTVVPNNSLNPFLRAKIGEYLNANPNGLNLRGKGLPGLHAEVFAMNDILNQLGVGAQPNADQEAELATLRIATVKTQGVNSANDIGDFEACPNCSGILTGIIDSGQIVTGVK